MKTPGAPVTRRRTVSSAVVFPRQSTFSHPAAPDRFCPSPNSELITHDSLPITNPVILHPQNSFISRFFTVFTFVSPCIHDFHAKKISARPATAGLTFLSEVPDLT